MIPVVIVDDEPWARASLRVLLAADPDVNVVAECASGEEAIQVIAELRPALVFLDVQMQGCDGFEVMERLGADTPAATVFVTAYDQYALRAFEVAAVDYLLKPFDDARFFRALARAKETVARRGNTPSSPERLIVRSAGRVAFLPVSEIDWIEASDYCVSIHVGTRVHVLRRTLQEMESDLDPRGFCRVHRSAIVNLDRVRELRFDANGSEEAVLRDGSAIRVSKGYRVQLRSRLGQSLDPESSQA